MSAEFNFWDDTSRRCGYDCGSELGTAVFLPKCPVCGRFVTADETVKVNLLGDFSQEPNATCARHGRVAMPFEGWF